MILYIKVQCHYNLYIITRHDVSQHEIIMGKQYDKALKFIYGEKRGTIGDLQKKISKETVDKFISVGFIICGYTPTAKTWKLSSLGKLYCEDFVL